jgi:hypothetical protein
LYNRNGGEGGEGVAGVPVRTLEAGGCDGPGSWERERRGRCYDCLRKE